MAVVPAALAGVNHLLNGVRAARVVRRAWDEARALRDEFYIGRQNQRLINQDRSADMPSRRITTRGPSRRPMRRPPPANGVRKRKAPPSARPTKRARLPYRKPPQAGEYGGVIRKRRMLRRKRVPVRKMATIALTKRILRWQRCNAMNRASGTTCPGALLLENRLEGTTNDNTLAPLHIYCLNSTRNNTATTTAPAYELRITDTGGLTFTQIQTVDAAGVLQNEWQPEYRDSQTSFDPSKRFIHTQWYDIRFLLYGARAQPSVYEIMVVSFKDPHLDPIETPSNAQEVSDRHAFYQGLVRPYMYNPILPSHGAHLIQRKLRVWKRMRVTIQPSQNTDVDSTPSSRHVRFFIKENRTYDYMYHADGFSGAGADNLLNTERWVVQGNVSGDFNEFPKPLARKWLIIRALNTTVTPNGVAATSDNTPSYDICIRKKETFASS